MYCRNQLSVHAAFAPFLLCSAVAGKAMSAMAHARKWQFVSDMFDTVVQMVTPTTPLQVCVWVRVLWLGGGGGL